MSDPPRPNPAYLTTVLELFPRAGEPLTVDLAQPLEPKQRRALGVLLGGSFAVVTACNPYGRPSDSAENERRARLLERELSACGRAFVRADGLSPDGSHRERGVAVKLNEAAARELAGRWEQEAFYWFDGEAFWLLGALQEMARKLPGRVG